MIGSKVIMKALKSESEIGAIQIPIVDWQAHNLERDPEVLAYVSRFRAWFQKHNLATGDKITTDMSPDGAVHTILPLQLRQPPTERAGNNSPDEGFQYNLRLPLPEKCRPKRPKKVHSLNEALSLVAQPYPGGNIPNMVRNFVQFLKAGLGPAQLHVLSSPEPTFEREFENLPPRVKERVLLTRMDLPYRTAFHLPYSKEGSIGTIALGTPSYSTLEEVKPHMQRLAQLDCVITSEGIGSLIVGSQELRGKLLQLLNPSHGWRPQCAVDALVLCQKQPGQAGRPPLVSMNGEEMDEFIRLMEAQKKDTTFREIPEAAFASPFVGRNLTLNPIAMRDANSGFSRYFRCIPPEGGPCLYFPLSVSLGSEGGYHIACREGKMYICFTTTPSEAGSKKMIRLLGNQTKISYKKQRVMGAGDAVATILSLVNTLDIESLLRVCAQPQDPGKAKFIQIASVLFTSLLSRVVGEYSFHSDRCDLSEVPPEAIIPIIENTARLALQQARLIWNATGKPRTMRVNEWGINIALWEFRE